MHSKSQRWICRPIDKALCSLWELGDESGQAVIVAALAMTVLLGFLGMAIDGGQLRYQKRHMQMAADAAAQAAALEIATCAGVVNCSAMKTAAQSALLENGFTGLSLLSNCSPRAGTLLELTINNPPCATTSDRNLGNMAVVEVVVSRPVPTVFARLVGVTSVPILARAEATMIHSACVYALDPSNSATLLFDNNTTTNANCNILAESTSSASTRCTNATVSSTAMTLAGDGTFSNCAQSGTFVNNGRIPSPSDPLASLTKPSVPACGSSTRTPYTGSSSALAITGTATLSPTRAYCGGISIRSGANVTFQPGTYVLGSSSSAGGLSIDVNATVNGTGVTFYNYGASGAVQLTYSSYTSGAIHLVAPTTGTYAGVLLFQDARNTTQATLLGRSQWQTVLQGIYYFPSAKVMYTYSGSPAYNSLLASQVEFAYSNSAGTGASTFNSDFSSLPGGPPIGNPGVMVVQ